MKGFTLVEALVALAVVGLILLLGLGLVWQQRQVIERLEAREAADRALTEALETLRSGAVPVTPGIVPLPVASSPGAAQGLTVVVRVTPAEPPPDLYRARVTATYRVAGRAVTRSLETQLWRPGMVKAQ